jgi:hypothetical protein
MADDVTPEMRLHEWRTNGRMTWSQSLGCCADELHCGELGTARAGLDGERGNGESARERKLGEEESSAVGGRRDSSPIYRGRGEGESADVIKHQ